MTTVRSAARPSGVPASPHRRVAWLLGIAVWLVYLTTAGGTLGTGDAVAMYTEARAIVTRGATDVPASESEEAWRGTDGRYYTPFGIGQPLYDVPFLLAGRAISRVRDIAGGDPDVVPKAVVALASTIPAAAAVAFGFLLAWRLSADLAASLSAGLALAFGTLLWPYATLGFNAALTAGTLTAGLYGLAAGWTTRRPAMLLAGGLGVGWAMLTRHEMMLAGAVCLVWLTWHARGRTAASWRLAAAGAAGIAAAACAWLLLNQMRFGDPFRTGHVPAFSLAGAVAFLVSPSGAIWLYSPVAVAGLALVPRAWRGDPLSRLMLGVAVVMGTFYAALDDWLGTRSYGPRYLVPLLPLLGAPLAIWIGRARTGVRRILLVLLCATSVIVQLPAVTVDPARAGIAAGQPPQSVRRDDWHWTPVWLNLRYTMQVLPENVRYVTGRAPVPETARATSAPASLADRLWFSLDFWWLYLFYLGVLSRAALLTAALLPLVLAAALLAAARHLARRDSRDTAWPGGTSSPRSRGSV